MRVKSSTGELAIDDRAPTLGGIVGVALDEALAAIGGGKSGAKGRSAVAGCGGEAPIAPLEGGNGPPVTVLDDIGVAV